MDLNLTEVQLSVEQRVGLSLIFSMLLDLVTVVIAPHSSPRQSNVFQITMNQMHRENSLHSNDRVASNTYGVPTRMTVP
jgi:hypothetical protein